MAKMNIYNVNRWETAAHEAQYQAATFCKMIEISARQLRRYAHKIFGKSTQDCLNDLRLQIAPGLLKKLPSVKQVAIELGFKHHSHFTSMFRDYYGVCPTAYLDWHAQHEQAMRRYRQQRD